MKLQLASSSTLSSSVTEESLPAVSKDPKTDYSVHPLVLGPGYVWDDLQTVTVNSLNTDVSGVLVVGVNKGGVDTARRLQRLKLPTTYQVKGEFGRATHNGWVTGKTRMKCSWRHLTSRPWLLDNYLSNICAVNQRKAWDVSDADLDTQEGYEKALLGPPKPDILSEAIVYSIKCSSWNPPHFTLDVVCIEPRVVEELRQKWLLDLVQEIGVRCKTVAQVHRVRCVGVGPWGTEPALLFKHWTLEHLLASMADNRKIVKQIWKQLEGEKKGVFTASVAESNDDKHIARNVNFSDFLSDKNR